MSDAEPVDSVFTLLGIDVGLMPPLSRSGVVTGEVTTSAADDTGLASGTPVISGGPDTQCGLLGLGATRQGQMGILAGWSGPLQFVTDTLCMDAETPNMERKAHNSR